MSKLRDEEFIARYVVKIKELLHINDAIALKCAKEALEWKDEETPEQCAEYEAAVWRGDAV